MKEFRGKVAVVTGAASGIGRALAIRCAEEGINVVGADINESALTQTVAEVGAFGVRSLGVVTDVTNEKDVQALAQKAFETFGAVHLLFNLQVFQLVLTWGSTG